MKKIRIVLACALSAAAIVGVCACTDTTESVTTYKVTFDTSGGSTVASYSLAEGSVIGRPATNPTKELFVFDDWYTDLSCTQKFAFDSTRMPNNDITIFAGWLGEQSVKITLDANGGEFADNAIEMYSIGNVGATFASPSVRPSKAGYSFGGWYTDAQCTDAYRFTVYPEKGVTLYAGWNSDAQYVYVSYYGNGALVAEVPVKKGEAIAEAKLFDNQVETTGWYTNAEFTGSEYTFGAQAESDVKLYTTYYSKGLTIENGEVVRYSGDSRTVYVPSVYDGVAVTSIGEYAFYASNERDGVVTVNLPDTITSLKAGAFYDCTYLQNVNLTKNLTEIGENAFFNNTRLKNYGDLTAVKTVGAGAFIGCESIKYIEFSENATHIGDHAFSDCKALLKFVVPAGVNEIGDYMFSGCTSIASVEIKAPALKSISVGAFENCKSLKNVVISSVSLPAFVLDGNTVNNRSPFADIDVQIAVPSSMRAGYLSAYGYLDDDTFGQKIIEIG